MQKIYVETWGNDDTGDGSASNPYATLKKAFSIAYNNHLSTEECTIYLGEGKFDWNTDDAYTFNNLLTITGKNEKTTITPSTPIQLSDLKIMNTVIDCSNSGSIITGSTMVNLYVYNCVFKNSGGRCIYNYTKHNCVIKNCTFINAQSDFCIWHTRSQNTKLPVIEGCCVDSSSKSGITLTGKPVTQSVEDATAFNVEYDPETYRLTNADNSLYGVYSGEYAWRGGYLLFMNNKYYSILPNHFVDGAYQEVDLATVKADENASDNYLFQPSALFEDLTIGEGESAVTFKPIEKFDNFQLVDVAAEELPDPLTVSGLKVNNAMISMIVPVSMKKYNVIHSVTATYEGTVRLAFSFDKGTTWKTFNTTDGVWEDLFIDIALKDYASYTVNDKTNWNKAKAKILTDGIDPADLEITDLINFNINAKTMLVAAAMERNDYDTPASFSGLTILYDSPNTYERVESTECKVAITGDTIEVTPTFANNELLITAVTNL